MYLGGAWGGGGKSGSVFCFGEEVGIGWFGAGFAQGSLIEEEGGSKDDEAGGDQFGFEDPDRVDLTRGDEGYDQTYKGRTKTGHGGGGQIGLVGVQARSLSPGVLEQGEEHVGGGEELED